MNSRVLSQDPTSPPSPDCPANTETQILFGIDQDDSPKIWTGIERVASSSPRTDQSQRAIVQYFPGSKREGICSPLLDRRQPPANWTRHVVHSLAATEHLYGSAASHNYLLQPQTATAQLPPELLDDSSRTIVVEIADPRNPYSPTAGASKPRRWQDLLDVSSPDPTVSRLDRS